MRYFKCKSCGAPLKVSEELLGRRVICTNCNTYLLVPPDAGEADPDAPPASSARPVSDTRGDPPRYDLAYFSATVISGFGMLVIVVGFFAALGLRNGEAFLMVFAGALISGMVLIGMGQLLFLARDIARNTWPRPGK